MTEFVERRRSERKNFGELPIVFSLVLAEPPKGETPLRLEARNISLHGLKFQTNHPISLFQELLIQLFEKLSNRAPIQLRSQVTRVEEVDTGRGEKIYGIAVQFAASGEADLNRLYRLFNT